VLEAPSYRLGRDPQLADILLSPAIMGDGQQAATVSRLHCTLGLEDGVPSLTDHSMNGSWVGSLRVGRGRSCCLDHCSALALLAPDRPLFTFLGRDAMERQFPAAVTERLVVGPQLGTGTTSEVHLAFRRHDLGPVALKLIRKTKWPSKYNRPTDLRREVAVLAGLEHPCITRVEEVLETEELLAIVMEHISGGELFDQVISAEQRGELSEETAKFQFYQVVDTVRYLHSRQVCHRDIKLENLLLTGPAPHSLIKVIDFGLAKVWGEDSELETYVGTPVYMAPEVVACLGSQASAYSSKSDCWSLGVVLYLLLCGRHPFSAKSETERDRKILGGRARPMEGPRWERVSAEAKGLVSALLEMEPEKRLSAEAVLQHPWFEGSPALVADVTGLLHRGKPVRPDGEVQGRAGTEGRPED
jgi:serine/threonine protein kinase